MTTLEEAVALARDDAAVLASFSAEVKTFSVFTFCSAKSCSAK